MAKRKKDPTFEELLEHTEEAVEQLESGELPLEEALAQYEKGVENLKKCSAMINEAQEKVMQVIEKREGELGLEPFDSDEVEPDGTDAE
jgi:exodeoxyribonuclease VII small subunit